MKIRLLLSVVFIASVLSAGAVEVLDTISVEGIRYVISSTDTPCCKVVYSQEGYRGDVVIPGHISVEGRDFEVVSIASGAFAFCKEMTSVKLPTSLRSVGKSAFSFCDNLEFLEIPEGVTYIDEYAFAGSHRLRTLVLPSTLRAINCTIFDNFSLTSVYCKSVTPPFVAPEDCGFNESTFRFLLNELSYAECNLYVPAGYEDRYMNDICTTLDFQTQDWPWRSAEHIYPFDFENGQGYQTVTEDSTIFKIRCRNERTMFSTYYGDNKDNLKAVRIDNIYYVVTSEKDRTCKVVAGDYYYHGDIVIPASVNINGTDYTVNEISNHAFCNCYLLISISFPETIEKIGSFRNCASLVSITIPKSIGDISSCIEGCYNLKKIVLGNETQLFDYRVNMYAGYGSYYNALVAHDSEYRPDPEGYALYKDNIYYIVDGDHATISYTDNVSRLHIPEEIMVDGMFYPVKTIGHNVFGNDLLYVSIPSSVDEIMHLNTLFYGCSLSEIDLSENSSLTGLDFRGLFSLQAENNVVYVGKSALRILDKHVEEPMVIKDRIRYIATEAFSGSSMTGITMPDGLTEILPYAFGGCYNLKEVRIPESVTAIGNGAFADCCNLESIEIPEGVTSAYLNSFKGCTKIKSITFPSGCQIGDTNPFVISNLDGCTWDLIWEDHFIQTHDERVYYAGYLDLHTMVSNDLYEAASSFTTRFSDDVTAIPTHFAEGKRLEKMKALELGNGVTAIGDFAFWQSENLKEIQINSTPSIGAFAFGASDQIEKITITSSVPPQIADLSKYCEPVMQAEDIFTGNMDFLGDSIVKTKAAMGGKVMVLYGKMAITDNWQADFDIEYETPGKYDVYVVVLPNGLLPEFTKTKPNQFNCFLNSFDKDGNSIQFTQKDPNRPARNYKYVNDKQKADTILIGQVEVFDNMPFGKDNKLTVSIRINMTASETQTYSNTMLLDAIILDQTEQTATVEEIDINKQKSVFTESIYANATLQVPAGSIDAYRSAPCWNQFCNIVEAEGTAGTEGLDFFYGFEGADDCRIETVTEKIRWNALSDIVSTETSEGNTYLQWKTTGINNDYDCELTDAVLKVGSFNLKAGVSYFVKFSVMSDCWTGNLQVDVVRRSDDMVLGHIHSLVSFSEDWKQYRGSFRIDHDCDDCYVRFSFLSPGQTFFIDDVSVSDKCDVEAVCYSEVLRLFFNSDVAIPQVPIDPVGIYDLDADCFEVTGINKDTHDRVKINLNYAELFSDNSINLFYENDMELYEEIRVSFKNLPSDNRLCVKYVSFIDPESKEKQYKPLCDFQDLAVRMDFSVSHGPDLRTSDPAPYSFENPTDTRNVTLRFCSHKELTSDGISARMLMPKGKAEYWKISVFDTATQTLVVERPAEYSTPLFGAATLVVDGLPFMCSVPMSFGVKGQVPDRFVAASADSAYTYINGVKTSLDIYTKQVMLYYKRSPEVLSMLKEKYGITPYNSNYRHLGSYDGELILNGRFCFNDAPIEATLVSLRQDSSVVDVERAIGSSFPYGVANNFQVVLKDRSYESALEKELKYTGTKIKSHTYGRLTYYIQVDRNSVADAIDCANMFYESGICSSVSLITEDSEHWTDADLYYLETYNSSKFYFGDEKYNKAYDQQTIVIYYEDKDDDVNDKTRSLVTDETFVEYLARVYGITVSDEYVMDSISYKRKDGAVIKALPFKLPEMASLEYYMRELPKEEAIDDIELTILFGEDLKTPMNNFLVEVSDPTDSVSFRILLEETGTELVGYDAENGLFELHSDKYSSGTSLNCLNTFYESGFCLNVYPIFTTLVKNEGPVIINAVMTKQNQDIITYDLNGRRVTEPKIPGVYIHTRVLDGKVIESRRVLISE